MGQTNLNGTYLIAFGIMIGWMACQLGSPGVLVVTVFVLLVVMMALSDLLSNYEIVKKKKVRK